MRAILRPCPHTHLFGLPNGMNDEQRRSHRLGCVRLDGEWYEVVRERERRKRRADDTLRSRRGPDNRPWERLWRAWV